jgi:hypothetical protein
VLVVFANPHWRPAPQIRPNYWQSPHEGHVAIKTIAKFRQACWSPRSFLLNPHIPIAGTHPQYLPISLHETSSTTSHTPHHHFLYLSCAFFLDFYSLFVFCLNSVQSPPSSGQNRLTTGAIYLVISLTRILYSLHYCV